MEEETKKIEVSSIDALIIKLYDSIMEKPLKVLDIFNNFFGEDRVDLQGYPSVDQFISDVHNSRLLYFGILGVDGAYSLDEITPDSKKVDLLELLFSKILTIGDCLFKNLCIIVHFPHVRVTNELDNFVDINHLWAKIELSVDGSLKAGFALNRSEYFATHFIANYMHSHISAINIDDFSCFCTPCTGSGPIKTTICSLNNEYNEELWNLFCFELSKYVEVESLEGHPYHKLDTIRTSLREIYEDHPAFNLYNNIGNYSPIDKDIIIEFVKYFINTKKLKFKYIQNNYLLGMSYLEYILLVSNEFISWYNEAYKKNRVLYSRERLITEGLLVSRLIKNGKIYSFGSSFNRGDYYQYIGKKVLTFKGKDILLSIINDFEDSERRVYTLLNVRFALYLLNVILKVLNYRYGRDREETQSNIEVRFL